MTSGLRRTLGEAMAARLAYRGTNPTLLRRSYASHFLHTAERRAEWQVSWGFSPQTC